MDSFPGKIYILVWEDGQANKYTMLVVETAKGVNKQMGKGIEGLCRDPEGASRAAMGGGASRGSSQGKILQAGV